MPLIVLEHSVRTAAYHIAGPKPDCPLFYFIPGNPGLCEYYEVYLEQLKANLPEFEFLCPSHIGFNTLGPEGEIRGKIYNLDDQIKHKIDILNEFLTQPRDVYIFGHSVGSWISQRVTLAARDNENARVRSVGLITPTVMDIAKSDRGRRLTKLMDYVGTKPGNHVGRLSYLIYWNLSESVLNRIVRWFMGPTCPQFAVDATRKLISRPRIVRQAINMGAEEMFAIGSDPEPEDIQGFWDGPYKIWAYFAHDDHWVHEDTKNFLVDKFSSLPNVDIYTAGEDDGIIHAFCLRQSVKFANITTVHLKSVL